MSPAEVLEKNDLTQMLRLVGTTEADLALLRFIKFNPELPFGMWAITGPEWLVVKYQGLSRAYCALRWLVIDDPPSSRNKSEGRHRRLQSRPANPVAGGLRQADRIIRPTRRVICLYHPILQHDDQHGPSYTQCPAVLCSIRTRGHRGTSTGQDFGIEEERHLGRRPRLWATPA
jgi:hypothetical protein